MFQIGASHNRLRHVEVDKDDWNRWPRWQTEEDITVFEPGTSVRNLLTNLLLQIHLEVLLLLIIS